MSGKRLRVVGLEPEVLHILNRNHLFTCRDVLSKTDFELMNILNVSVYVVKKLMEQVSKAVAPVPVTALSMLERRKKECCITCLPTSLDELDAILRGGLPVGSITEFAGPAGCGKTQFCLLMSVMATLVSVASSSDDATKFTIGGGVIYIDTEMTFSPHRLVEIAINRFPSIFMSLEAQRDLLSRIHVYNELSCASLLGRLERLEEVIVSLGVKLVVLDSVASLLRKEFDAGIGRNMAERSNLLARIAAILKQTSEALEIPIVTTNQITTHINRSTDVLQQAMDEQDVCEAVNDTSYVTVALGNTWSHCVNTRLIVQYVDAVKRQLLVAKSPVAPFVSFTYTINASGIVMLPGGASFYQGTDPGQQHIKVKSSTFNSNLTC